MKRILIPGFSLFFAMACVSPSFEDAAKAKEIEKADINAAKDVLIKQQLKMIPFIDDGISDASTIALALTNACMTEYMKVTEVACKYLDNNNQVRMYKERANSVNGKIQFSLPVVLFYRSQKQKGKG
jgi:hypothetical protein